MMIRKEKKDSMDSVKSDTSTSSNPKNFLRADSSRRTFLFNPVLEKEIHDRTTITSSYIIKGHEGDFSAHVDKINTVAFKIRILKAGMEITFQDAFSYMTENTDESELFFSIFLSTIRKTPFNGLFWECKKLDLHTLNQPFEYVVVDCAHLDGVPPDPGTFCSQIKPHEGTNEVVVFPNLGGDALLVVPCKNGPAAQYAHLVAFLRSAPRDHVTLLFKNVAQEALRLLLEEGWERVWISTSGLGVYWLHVRLDKRPKYYTFPDYKNEV